MREDRILTGWGRTAPSRSSVVEPCDRAELRELLGDASGPGRSRRCIARGLGRSYGDAAQCAGGRVLSLRRFSRIEDVDPRTGTIEVEGGASLDALIRRTLPKGWFLPVTPGTRQVTIGGALAADVHGKNHHHDGSFCRHVEALTLESPAGTFEVAPERDSELFWATAGGMGLTGVVVRARLRLLAVETDRMLVDTDRFGDLDALMAAMEEGDDRYRYSVAWLDCTAGKRAGRGVLTRGDHARSDDLRTSRHRRSGTARWRLRIPRKLPAHPLNGTTVRALNEAWYRMTPRRLRGEIQHVGRFFHPLDGVADWNRLYGPRGFVQYQFVVGPQQGAVVRRCIELLSTRGLPSSLAVLKRFGPGNPGPLSFPMAGWTLALDLPVGPEPLPSTLDELDEMVASAGGRVYLAKDARLRPDLLAAMYPRARELDAVRRRVDPAGVLGSDLSRRLVIDSSTLPI
jgi:decaprenylphospho-beta-D-ribofuranose 2-oxidase